MMRLALRSTPRVVAAALGLWACDGETDAHHGGDAGGPDASTGFDGSVVPDAETPRDAEADDDGGDAPTIDASAGSDAGPASDGGTGTDAGNTGDAGDGDETSLWDGCPESADYVGPITGTNMIVATADAVYCAMFDESRTLKEELAAKGMLRVAPAVYSPLSSDHASFRLPICLRAAQPPHPMLGPPGTLDYESSTYDGVTTHRYNWTQAIAIADVTHTLMARFDIAARAGEAPSMVLDGSHPLLSVEARDEVEFTLCEDPQACWPAQRFDSCHFDGSHVHRHVVTLDDDGTVTLELHIGESFASTEPGAFVRGNGSFRGYAFDQRDYWKLVYNPEHHHFVRDFAVLFDAPVAGVCGIEITNLEPAGEDMVPDEAYAVDCELSRLETLSVTAHSHTRIEANGP